MRPDFWADKRVFLTGHTGFKGVWCTLLLAGLGARVSGFSLAPDTDPSLFRLVGGGKLAGSTIADLGDRRALGAAINKAAPDIVLHMAAQPLVRRSYREPVATFATNVMGTVNLLEEVRTLARQPQASLIVTTDKVYQNDEAGRAFVEGDRLGGHDPYAASKAAAELAVESYKVSYFDEIAAPLATARGGNVIGGGDFSEDRLVPDIVRANMNGEPLVLRNPSATRPWQHVLDCLDGYLGYLEALAERRVTETSLNFGPQDASDVLTVGEVQQVFSRAAGISSDWVQDEADQPHEMQALSIDSNLAQKVLNWQGKLSSSQAVQWTADWYSAWWGGEDPMALTSSQIDTYLAEIS